jgi:hypothetical protein
MLNVLFKRFRVYFIHQAIVCMTEVSAFDKKIWAFWVRVIVIVYEFHSILKYLKTSIKAYSSLVLLSNPFA